MRPIRAGRTSQPQFREERIGTLRAGASYNISIRIDDFNIGRGVGSLGPLTVGALATKYSFHAALALLASIYILDVVVTLFLIPELKGRPLD